MRFLLLLNLLALLSPVSAQLVGDTENGLASYYSNEYQGAETAYGVVYDRNQLVAAHRLYPLNSTVRVQNMDNGQSVVVRIIDKGPFIKGRIIELSERAAAAIGLVGKETVPVELTLLSTPDQSPVAERRPVVDVADEPAPQQATPEVTVNVVVPDPAPASTPAPAAPRTQRRPEPVQQPAPRPTVTPAAREVKAQPVSNRSEKEATAFGGGFYKIAISKPAKGGFGVQVGSFTTLESAMDKVTELQGKYFDNILLEVVPSAPTGKGKYKVILGPFDTDKSALRYAADLKKRYKIPGFTVPVSGK